MKSNHGRQERRIQKPTWGHAVIKNIAKSTTTASLKAHSQLIIIETNEKYIENTIVAMDKKILSHSYQDKYCSSEAMAAKDTRRNRAKDRQIPEIGHLELFDWHLIVWSKTQHFLLT